MNRIIHYTSNEKWEQIQESGLLLPKSDPNDSNLEISDRVRDIIQDNTYLVGIPEHLDDRWVECGLMEHLIHYTTDEVALNVPILNKKRGFVRDHIYASPKRYINLYGEDLFVKVIEGEAESDDPRWIEAVKVYLESTTPLDTYDGSYFVPEIWLCQETPVRKIKKL